MRQRAWKLTMHTQGLTVALFTHDGTSWQFEQMSMWWRVQLPCSPHTFCTRVLRIMVHGFLSDSACYVQVSRWGVRGLYHVQLSTVWPDARRHRLCTRRTRAAHEVDGNGISVLSLCSPPSTKWERGKDVHWVLLEKELWKWRQLSHQET